MRPDGLHERGKQLVESIRSSPRSANPFLITERAEEKQITLSSRDLQLSDFGLMKTLGTGESDLVFYHRLQPANSALFSRDFCAGVARETERAKGVGQE
jgi:hypothetical protein